MIGSLWRLHTLRIHLPSNSGNATLKYNKFDDYFYKETSACSESHVLKSSLMYNPFYPHNPSQNYQMFWAFVLRPWLKASGFKYLRPIISLFHIERNTERIIAKQLRAELLVFDGDGVLLALWYSFESTFCKKLSFANLMIILWFVLAQNQLQEGTILCCILVAKTDHSKIIGFLADKYFQMITKTKKSHHQQ